MYLEYLKDLIDEKETLFPIFDMVDCDFNIGIHERIYLWAVEVRYLFRKIENKDKLIEEILSVLDSVEGGLFVLEIRRLKAKLDIFLKYKDLYFFSS